MSAPLFRAINHHLDSSAEHEFKDKHQSLGYHSVEQEPHSLGRLGQEDVVVNAGETLALLMHAARSNRAWLNDFADETLRVSRDMYEVLLHYKRITQNDNSRAA